MCITSSLPLLSIPSHVILYFVIPLLTFERSQMEQVGGAVFSYSPPTMQLVHIILMTFICK